MAHLEGRATLPTIAALLNMASDAGGPSSPRPRVDDVEGGSGAPGSSNSFHWDTLSEKSVFDEEGWSPLPTDGGVLDFSAFDSYPPSGSSRAGDDVLGTSYHPSHGL